MTSRFSSVAGVSAASLALLLRRLRGSSVVVDAPSSWDGPWLGVFDERHPLNVPGPFYAAATDTCCRGPVEAPHNVLHDDEGLEFVWQQPRDDAEARAITRAAETDPLLGYGRNGNDHWTPILIAEWWHELPARQEHVARVLSSPLVQGNSAENTLVERARREWTRYWASPELLADLRRYSFRQDAGRWPEAHEALPVIKDPRR